MSNLDKQALRERYSAKPIPKCHICGTEMTVQHMSGCRITYGCTGATYDDTGCHYAAGRSIADDHYEQSRVTVVDASDPDVLALLDELEVRCAALAAEVYDLKHPGTYLPSKRETPALDAFLAEVRAQGVEMFAAHKRERQQALRSRSMRMSEEAAGMAADAEEFAAQLRKGVQS